MRGGHNYDSTPFESYDEENEGVDLREVQEYPDDYVLDVFDKELYTDTIGG